MKLESRVQEEVEKDITQMMKLGRPITFWRISNTFMANFPDFLVCYKGIFVGIELKRDEKTRARLGQYKEMKKIQDAGGISRVVGSVREFRRLIVDIDSYLHGIASFDEIRLKTEEFLDD